MDEINNGWPFLLTLLTFIPLVFVGILLMPNWERSQFKVIAAIGAGVNFVLSLVMLVFWDFNIGNREIAGSGMTQMQFALDVDWLGQLGIRYHMGVDGLAMLLIILTTLLSLISILVSWEPIQKREREYYIWLLVLETGMIGVFVSLNFFLFYIFWELMLVPMALLIGIWGSGNRVYAALKFFLYTLAGSLLMLVAIIALYLQTGTLEIIPITQYMNQNAANLRDFQVWVFLAFTAAFAVKVPMFPFHTWLPDAHVQAPTAGSIILAGVMLKMGGFGFIRFALPMAPDGAAALAPVMVALSVIGIIYGALVSLVQTDLKKLIAYSSVSHMGFVTLGLFTSIWLTGGDARNAVQGIDGAVLVMLSHGFLTGALFLCVGVVYNRLHTREIKDMGGLTARMPVYSLLFLLITMGSLGLPLLSGFVGEFLVMLGAFRASPIVGTITTLIVIFAAWYLLWMYQRVMFQQPKRSSAGFRDLNRLELIGLVPLALLSILMGVFPGLFLDYIQAGDMALLHKVAVSMSSPEVVGFLTQFTR
ncbi:MAG TPA: NADH-quinone oxidoreductase subunit M [Chloroflexia bacterium]|nr:NADH-quinone oxidoreductase subunit M [Chloroflexia bacterium]